MEYTFADLEYTPEEAELARKRGYRHTERDEYGGEFTVTHHSLRAYDDGVVARRDGASMTAEEAAEAAGYDPEVRAPDPDDAERERTARAFRAGWDDEDRRIKDAQRVPANAEDLMLGRAIIALLRVAGVLKAHTVGRADPTVVVIGRARFDIGGSGVGVRYEEVGGTEVLTFEQCGPAATTQIRWVVDEAPTPNARALALLLLDDGTLAR